MPKPLAGQCSLVENASPVGCDPTPSADFRMDSVAEQAAACRWQTPNRPQTQKPAWSVILEIADKARWRAFQALALAVIHELRGEDAAPEPAGSPPRHENVLGGDTTRP